MRLGSKGEVNEVLFHPWFKDLDRSKVFKKQIKPPYMPKVEGKDWL